MGSGKRMFQIREDRPTVNTRTAYQNNQLLLILISEMDMPEFSAGIGRLAVTDARMMIAARMNGSIDKKRKVRVIMDEFSAYASSNILSILSRARSSESVAYLSTQSVYRISLQYLRNSGMHVSITFPGSFSTGRTVPRLQRLSLR